MLLFKAKLACAIQSKTRLNSTSNFVEQSVVSTDYDIHSHDEEEALESSGPLHELEDVVVRFFCSRQCPLDIRAFWHFVPAANAKEYFIDDHIIHGGTGTLEPPYRRSNGAEDRDDISKFRYVQKRLDKMLDLYIIITCHP
jgi:hypothetical protein